LRNRSYEPAVWWIYFTLFSTLLPTIVHAVAGVKSLLGWTFGKKQRRRFIVDIQDRTAVGEGNHMASVEIACAFARRDVLAWVLTGLGVALLLSLLFWGLPGLARALLFACEWLAQMLGANIVPGDILPMISPDIAPAIKQWLI
ncbi:MAG: hypothetical protein GY927_11145, partial [bacterium]|nr:hypothetical protein [bacterium]